MSYKAIIFDMDGTIIDTENVWRDATVGLIESKGFKLTNEQKQYFEDNLKGLALHASCTFIKNELNLEDSLHQLVHEKQQLALRFLEESIRFIEGFHAFHEQAVAHDLKVAIATNADDLSLQKAIETLKLDNFFGKHIYNISHVNMVHKPHPDVYLHAAKQLDVDPEHCIAIEDSYHGVKAAVTAGMYCVGINTSKDKKQLREAHHIIDRYEELCIKTLLIKKQEKK